MKLTLINCKLLPFFLLRMYSFDTEYVQNRTIFIIYIFYILLLYFFIWSKFVGQLQNELWKTKSMLG